MPTPPPIMLAHRVEDFADVAGWWSTEKVDGVRAYWDGHQFITRGGLVINAPQWYIDAMPALPLDGELWLGRGRFDQTSGVIRRINPRQGHTEWRSMAYVVFDAPTTPGGFETRIEAARAAIVNTPNAFVIPMVKIVDAQHVRDLLAAVEAKGGEGLMARKPGSPYVVGRTHNMLKIKTLLDDEAVVTEHTVGDRGKPGVKALWRGTEIKIVNGFLADGSNRPPVGATVTFGYTERNRSGKPRFPIFIRERKDQ